MIMYYFKNSKNNKYYSRGFVVKVELIFNSRKRITLGSEHTDGNH